LQALCKECGNLFESKHRNHVYCGPCGTNASRLRRSRRLHKKDKRAPKYVPISQLSEAELQERRLKAKEYKWKMSGIKGATATKYKKLLKEQNNLCAICGAPPKKRALALDHDHKTMEIRGLLCYQCNYGLPWLERFCKSKETLELALKYIGFST
jgi:hypothetical protein